jgi:NitT/TauT family transport system ATP-binding protein
MKPILKIKDLKKIYHTKKSETLAVSDFSYDLKKNEFVSIVGPSGCGKSTILSILAGSLDASGGSIIKEESITFGYMLQEDCLFEFRTILDNCLLGLEINHALNEENKNYVISLLEKYGLKDFMHSYPKNLSGGMRQRVALIRTLALKPDILLLDEPFSALDYVTRLNVSKDVLQILRMEGKSAIMVTHNLEEALTMSDTIIVLSGRPSHIKNIYVLDFDKNLSAMEKKKTDLFLQYYNLIWKDIDGHV